MAKILYTPFSILGGLIAGFVARKVFNSTWALIDDSDGPPTSKQRDAPATKLLIGAVLEAGVFAAARVLFDRHARRAFHALFGAWPGDKEAA